MARRVFISYEGHDRNRAKGFQHLRWNKNVDIEFVGPHLLRPVGSTNEDYIARKIKEQLKRSSVAVVLIGRHTSESDWVAKEIQWALEKDTPLLGIKIEPNVRVPQALVDCGAGIIEWDPNKVPDAINRAVRGQEGSCCSQSHRHADSAGTTNRRRHAEASACGCRVAISCRFDRGASKGRRAHRFSQRPVRS